MKAGKVMAEMCKGRALQPVSPRGIQFSKRSACLEVILFQCSFFQPKEEYDKFSIFKLTSTLVKQTFLPLCVTLSDVAIMLFNWIKPRK